MRLVSFGIALILGTWVSASHAETGIDHDSPADSRVEKSEAKSGQRTRRRPKRSASFRGHAVPDGQLRQEPFPKPSGKLHVYSPNLLEEAKVNIYNADGSFNQDALALLSRIFRCKRTDTERPIEPHLFEILSAVYDKFGKRLMILSGFRNQRKVTSFHFHGTAADVHIEGISDKVLSNFASSLDEGGMGVGLYPRAHFVHIDVRPAPSFRWTDNSKSGDYNPGRMPPRGFRRQQDPES